MKFPKYRVVKEFTGNDEKNNPIWILQKRKRWNGGWENLGTFYSESEAIEEAKEHIEYEKRKQVVVWP